MENDFRKLALMIDRIVTIMVSSYLNENPEAGTEDYVWEATGMSLAAFQAGAIAYAKMTGDAPDQVDEQAAIAFARTYAWGISEAFRIAIIAISDPKAKGREIEVLATLQKGAKIRDALRVPSSSTAAAPGGTGAAIIPFRSR